MILLPPPCPPEVSFSDDDCLLEGAFCPKWRRQVHPRHPRSPSPVIPPPPLTPRLGLFFLISLPLLRQLYVFFFQLRPAFWLPLHEASLFAYCFFSVRISPRLRPQNQVFTFFVGSPSSFFRMRQRPFRPPRQPSSLPLPKIPTPFPFLSTIDLELFFALFSFCFAPLTKGLAFPTGPHLFTSFFYRHSSVCVVYPKPIFSLFSLFFEALLLSFSF